MNFLVNLWLSHWHCVVPVIAIAVVLIVQSRSGKKNVEK